MIPDSCMRRVLCVLAIVSISTACVSGCATRVASRLHKENPSVESFSLIEQGNLHGTGLKWVRTVSFNRGEETGVVSSQTETLAEGRYLGLEWELKINKEMALSATTRADVIALMKTWARYIVNSGLYQKQNMTAVVILEDGKKHYLHRDTNIFRSRPGIVFWMPINGESEESQRNDFVEALVRFSHELNHFQREPATRSGTRQEIERAVLEAELSAYTAGECWKLWLVSEGEISMTIAPHQADLHEYVKSLYAESGPSAAAGLILQDILYHPNGRERIALSQDTVAPYQLRCKSLVEHPTLGSYASELVNGN